ncbi:hypothetical protein SPRG_18880 [Saprolegnia parasitica CBS 223.65]|uniref:GAF domain-containing protein n=1 Tax=Saprolegnia parasitica (strain CBS 223.65) TaxID=695850 RepID=A0A067CYI0_SAPPC|nr:hypothetical protein SPRG_18880 [Saprolegnia parasitica CBS 223.65]KDO35734.1 hypothetical protein SPRG_18880 [Saprolegnia parasitica CBS 223.65]|eukprot:XP_012194094.1 hypothetical protein SPRG_18880 [Saprolegnia parasitica CBS 223.65]
MASEFFIVRSEYGVKDTQRYKPKPKALPPTDYDDVRDDRTLSTQYTPTHLNRIGSTPALPLQSAPGTHAFSSSKKRLFPSSSPKLTPLTPPQTSSEKAGSALDKHVQSLQATILNLEKELSDAHRTLQKERKHKNQLLAENTTLREHVDALTQRVADEREITTHQKKAFAKLSQKYVSVNESFHKLASAPSNETIKTVLATLARENQDHERRVRVLEAQHADDKKSLANAEKRVKLLKAELEAIEHMQMTQQAPSTDLLDAKSSIHATDLSDVGNLAPDDTSRSVAAMIEHYIDPNLMRILHKVDSQFSISNAINLSTTMKRWLHACQSIHVSLDIGVVLEELLKKVVSVLQCEHAALFQLDGKKLMCRCTNFGVTNFEIPADKGIVSYVLSSKTPCNLASAYDDPRFYSPQDNVTGITTRDIVCVPILDGRHDVLAVLRACNTTHYKGFSPNDEIVLSLFAVQAGILLAQFQMNDKLQASQAKLLRLHEMPRPLVSESVPSLASVSLIRFVLATERKFHDILGATKFKMFVLDDGPESSSNGVSATAMMWCVGTTLDPSCDTKHFRQYYKLSSGLCGVAMAHPRGLTVPTPFAHPKYNGAVDLNNLAHGLYVVPITSYWGKLLGVLQVARSATLAQGPKREVAQQQSADDDVRLHLLCIFAQTVRCALRLVAATLTSRSRLRAFYTRSWPMSSTTRALPRSRRRAGVRSRRR